ncbi:ribonuclease H-like domain-containing protein [Tanacetum coccineum]
MLIRSMAAKLTDALTGECLFTDFLFEIESKKVSEAYEHQGWVDGYRHKEEIYYDETFSHAARLEASRIFLAYATYMNFKVLQMDVKSAFLNGKLKNQIYVQTASSSLSSQNMAFVSSPSSTNEVNTTYGVSTANTQVSPASTQVSTASTQVSTTANLSDDTVYAFLASQTNGSQLVYEDLEQIHEDDIEEMDLKWQLALLSMRTRRFFQKTGRKTLAMELTYTKYDKCNVEYFNCHKMRHFARECRGPRNQDRRKRNQDSSRRTVNVEETSSKAMVAIDGAGFDWSYIADNQVPTNMALMAFSDSDVHNDHILSETCL